MPTISLVSINIERSKHLDTVLPFLTSHDADVVTLQEVMERDLPLLSEVLGAKYHFTPLCIFGERADEKEGMYGQAIFSKHAMLSTYTRYYAGEHDPLALFTEDKLASIARIAKALSYADIEVKGNVFRVATTHFTWSEKGEPDDRQRKDLLELFALLKPLGEFVLSGDFNAPRGRETWESIAAKYKDNIPLKYTSSIDPLLHVAAPLPYVVDGVFTTGHYAASDVELHTGVSDHCAVTARVSKLA